MCALLASTGKIVRIVNRGQVYELDHTAENTSKPALKNLQSALADLYSTTLELLANSSKLFSQNTPSQTIYAILHPGKTDGLFKKLDDLETRLALEVQACQGEKVCTLLEQVDKKEQVEMLEWISHVPYDAHHNTVKEARTPDTCEWYCDTRNFVNGRIPIRRYSCGFKARVSAVLFVLYFYAADIC